jgi:hypothetical protein
MALPSLSTAEERKIEKLINEWSAKKFTWELIVAKIEVTLNIKTTRQTLPTYAAIQRAYAKKKKEKRGGTPTDTVINITQSDVKMAERIEKLEKNNEQLEERVERQRAFIAEIVSVAGSNPSVMQVLEKVKNRIVL